MKSSPQIRMSTSHGFTLLELLVVVGIISIISAIAFPLLNSAKLRSHQSACASNVGQISKAILMYVDDSNGWPVFEQYDKDWAYQIAPYYGKPRSLWCPRFFFADPDNGNYRHLALPGYAMNVCLVTSQRLPRGFEIKDSSKVVLVGESGPMRCRSNTGEQDVVLEDTLVTPQTYIGPIPNCSFDEPRGDSRHSGGGELRFCRLSREVVPPIRFFDNEWVSRSI